MKNKKGITLIALIITIIVLLILAMVAIKAVSGDGIIVYAQNAATEYNQAQIDESYMLEVYANQVKNHEDGKVEDEEIVEDDEDAVGAKIIEFYIKKENETEKTKYTAKEGMTWYEWVNSKYNTYGYTVSGGNTEYSIVRKSNGGVDEDVQEAYATQVIKENQTYIVVVWVSI